MSSDFQISPAAVVDYLQSRGRRSRWLEWLGGRRYVATRFSDSEIPLFVIAHSFRDGRTARQVSFAIERDWITAPKACREKYEDVRFEAPEIIVIQLRRKNRCGCLGHRHPFVNEPPFTESHDALGGASIGEMDVAYKLVETWQAQPLSDAALDARFTDGSRLEDFHEKQFRLKLLSVILHETHHLVSPRQPESAIRERSLAFYHDALAAYVESATATLSLTTSRSFHRSG
jgi:hypothetical protein